MTANSSDLRPLVYVDTNILGLIAAGDLRLPQERAQYVFSAEHLTEIARTDSPDFLLEVLADLGAAELSVDLDRSFDVIDTGKVTPVSNITVRFAEHVAAMERGASHIDLFQRFIALGWGADNQAELLSQIGDIPANLKPLIGGDSAMLNRASAVSAELMEVVAKIQPNSATQVRRALGLKEKIISDYDPSVAVDKIWEQIEPRMPGATKEALFGKAAPDGRAKWSAHLGIIACYGMLNTLGYHADEKRNRLSGTRRAMSDGVHLANAAFCQVLLTHDRRFAAKARAVLSYLGHSTQVGLLERKHP